MLPNMHSPYPLGCQFILVILVMYRGNHMGWGLVLAPWLGQVVHQADPLSPLVIHPC